MTALVKHLDRIGPIRFAILLVLLPASLLYFAAGLYAASGLDPLHVVTDERSLGDDFVAFWAASRLALDGAPALAYDTGVLGELERAITGPLTELIPWHYPPTFMLAVMPFALVPYPIALFFWLLIPLVALSWLTQQLFRTLAYSWTLPLFPSAVICVVSGQNGFLTAFLIGAALLHLDRRPIFAGICCGLLTWKPHLAALLLAALLAGGYWRVLASAVATAAGLIIASIAVLGLAPWHAFIDNLAYVTRLLDTGGMPWERMPSVYISARLLGLDVALARIIQVGAALAALAAVCAIWYRGAALAWRGAAIAAALPLVTPYVFDYDLILLAFAVAWLLNACLKDGWQPGETLVVTLVWIGPAISWPYIEAGGVPFMPVVFAALLAVVWRRAFPSVAPSLAPSARTVC
jgi:Glycosyltransferase family 87